MSGARARDLAQQAAAPHPPPEKARANADSARSQNGSPTWPRAAQRNRSSCCRGCHAISSHASSAHALNRGGAADHSIPDRFARALAASAHSKSSNACVGAVGRREGAAPANLTDGDSTVELSTLRRRQLRVSALVVECTRTHARAARDRQTSHCAWAAHHDGGTTAAAAARHVLAYRRRTRPRSAQSVSAVLPRCRALSLRVHSAAWRDTSMALQRS